MACTTYGPYTDEHFIKPFEQITLPDAEDGFLSESNLLDYLKDGKDSVWQKTFSERLTEYIKKCGYLGTEDDLPAKVKFLWNMCRNTPLAEKEITKNTLRNWFQETRPDFHADSRNRMFVLCFVLRLSYEEVQHFFHHVYLDRCFNCRDKREAVYCYCFSHNQDYRHALSLLKQVDMAFGEMEYSDTKNTEEPFVSVLYTSDLKEDILSFANDEEFICYMVKNRESFLQYNVRGKKELRSIIGKIKGIDDEDGQGNKKNGNTEKASYKDYEIIEKLRKKKDPRFFSTLTYREFHGYLLRELFYNDPNFNSVEGVLGSIQSMDIRSDRFMLSHILGIDEKHSKRFYSQIKQLAPIACLNFPSKHILSKIFSSPSVTDNKIKVSFDAIRKMLILLHFYQFTVGYFIGENIENEGITRKYIQKFYESYKDDANDLLVTCGYPPLYKGSPYDLIFLFCANVEISNERIQDIISKGSPPSIPPLDAFREFVSSFAKDREDEQE